MKPRIAFLALVLLTGALLAACGSGSGKSAKEQASTTTAADRCDDTARRVTWTKT